MQSIFKGYLTYILCTSHTAQQDYRNTFQYFVCLPKYKKNNLCRCSVIALQQYAGAHKSRATNLFTLAPNICWSLVWNLLHVTLVALKILK
jgi:hypothetical protein